MMYASRVCGFADQLGALMEIALPPEAFFSTATNCYFIVPLLIITTCRTGLGLLSESEEGICRKSARPGTIIQVLSGKMSVSRAISSTITAGKKWDTVSSRDRVDRP